MLLLVAPPVQGRNKKPWFIIMPEMNDDINLIGTQVHPIYSVKRNMWVQIAKAYSGGVMYKYAEPSYLHRFDARETDVSYQARRKRAVYLNNVQPLSDMIAGFVFSSNPDRKGIEAVDYIIDNANQYLGMNEFMKMVALNSLLYTCGVLVDSPEFNPEEVATEADRREKGINPFCVLYMPWQIRNYHVGRDGKLDWIVLDDTCYDNISPTKRAQIKFQYTVWTRKTIQRYTANVDISSGISMYNLVGARQGDFANGMDVYNLYEFGHDGNGDTVSFNLEAGEVKEHPCGEVPFRFANWTNKNRSYFVDTIFEDITLFDQAIYNFMSLMDEVISGGVFKYLFWPGAAPKAATSGGLSHCAILEYDITASSPPNFDGPTLGDIAPFLTVLDFLVAAIRRSLGLETDINKSTAQSGVAKQYDFSKLGAFLNMGAGAMASIEKDIFRLAGLWEGKAVYAEIEYRKDIIGKDEEAELARLYQAIMLPYAELRRIVAKRIAALNLSDVVDEDEMQVVYDDIDTTENAQIEAATMRGNVTPEQLAEMAKNGAAFKDINVDDIETPVDIEAESKARLKGTVGGV